MNAEPLPEREAPETGAAAVEAGAVLFGKLRPYLAKSWLVDRPIYASTELLALMPRDGVDPRWLGYVCRSKPLVEWSVATSDGTKMPRTTWEKLGDFQIDVPPPAGQRLAADFIDVETARIDALIEKKHRMISLLGARHREAVSAAALRGLRDRQLRPTRSGFLGAVPAAWEETQLRHFDFSVQTGPFGSQLHAAEYVEDGWPVINPANLVDSRIRADKRVTITDERRADLQVHLLGAGDIIFGRRGEMGRAALVTEAEEGWVCGTGCLRLRPRGSRLDPEYLLLLLQTPALRAYFSLAAVGSTMENLNAEILLAAPVLIPPADEQLEIIKFAAQAAKLHRAVAACLARQVNLLRERRQALITAAVTGQLDAARTAA